MFFLAFFDLSSLEFPTFTKPKIMEAGAKPNSLSVFTISDFMSLFLKTQEFNFWTSASLYVFALIFFFKNSHCDFNIKVKWLIILIFKIRRRVGWCTKYHDSWSFIKINGKKLDLRKWMLIGFYYLNEICVSEKGEKSINLSPKYLLKYSSINSVSRQGRIFPTSLGIYLTVDHKECDHLPR